MTARLLIVEDDKIWGNILSRRLRSIVEMTMAATVREAEALLDTPFTGAVIDVGLPDGSGLSLAMRTRERNADIELLLFTADEDHRIVDDAARHNIGCAHKQTGFGKVEQFAEMCARIARAEQPSHARLARRGATWGLTKREHEIVTNVLDGLSPMESASRLALSRAVLDMYTNALLVKTGHERIAELVASLGEDTATWMIAPPDHSTA